MSTHAFLSPSFAHIGYKCPAAALRSFQVKQRAELLREIAVEYYGLTVPDEVLRLEKILEEDTESADEGTALHEIFEDAMNGVLKKQSDVIDAIKSHPKITSDTKDDAFIHSRLCQCIKEQRAFIKTCDWFEVEKRIKVRGLPQHGTIDLIAGNFKKKTLYARDLKTGYNEVDPKENEQLMTYAVGLLDEIGSDGMSGWDRYNKVEIVILGVRWETKPWTVSTYDLKKFKQEVMYPAFMNAYSITPEAIPGDHCRYCVGKIHCKPWQDKFNGAANQTYSDDDVEDMPTERLVELWKLCKQAETLMKQQLGPEIMQRFDGFDVPQGVKRVSGNKIVKYKVDESEVVKHMRKKAKRKSDLYKQTLLTPKQLQAQLGLKDEDLEKITEVTHNKPYLML